MFKVKVDGNELKKIIEGALCNMNKKMSIPILHRVVFSTKDGRLSAYTTDIENYLKVYTDESIIYEVGDIGIDVEDLKVLLKMNNEVTITELDDSILVQNEKKSISLIKYDMQDFPQFPDDSFEDMLVFKECEFAETLNNLVAFTSDRVNHPMLQCINYNLADNRIEALDGNRIGMKLILDNEKLSNTGRFLLLNSAVSSLKKTLDKKLNSNVVLSEGSKFVKISGDGFTYIQKKIEGEYYKLNHMLPNDFEISFDVNAKAMLAVFKYYTENVIDKKDKKPTIMKIENKAITTYGRNARFEVADSIEIANHNGIDLKIAFNPYYIVDALKVADADIVKINGTNPKAPFMIYADRYSFLVLPDKSSSAYLEEMEVYLRKVKEA